MEMKKFKVDGVQCSIDKHASGYYWLTIDGKLLLRAFPLETQAIEFAIDNAKKGN